MSEEYYRNEEVSFRIVGLPSELLSEFKKCVDESDLEMARYEDTDSFVVCVTIKKDSDYQNLYDFIVNNKIPEDSYGIYVSLVTESDHDGVRVPDYASALVKKLGGKIDFSCTRV